MSDLKEDGLSVPLTSSEYQYGDRSPTHRRMMHRQNTSRPKTTSVDQEPIQVSVTKPIFPTKSSVDSIEKSSTASSDS